MLKKTPAAKRARAKAREEAAVRKALGYTKQQWDSMRGKRRKTRADAVDARLKAATAGVFDLYQAVRTAMSFQLGRMINKARLSERDHGALDLIELILDECAEPGVSYRLLCEEIQAKIEQHKTSAADLPAGEDGAS